MYERVHGSRFAIQYAPADALRAQQEAATDPVQQSFSGLMRCYADGDPIAMRPLLQAMPMELTSVETCAMASRPWSAVH